MSNQVPIKYFDIADDYIDVSAKPVSEPERAALARYFELLITLLSNNEEISEEAQHEMAAEAGLAAQHINEVAEYLNQWGNE